MEKDQNQSLMHSFTGDKGGPFLNMKMIIVFLVVVLVGIGSGYLLANKSSATTITDTENMSKSAVQVGQSYGSTSTKDFPDTAEGVLASGGIDGEGQYHLVRPGGDSQNVYLTSSAVDLSIFVKHKIKVWGQTQQSKKAGWLMDVGKVQVEQ